MLFQVADVKNNLNTINDVAQEVHYSQFISSLQLFFFDMLCIHCSCMMLLGQVRNSDKLKRVMQTILSLGNALNQGTARGESANPV